MFGTAGDDLLLSQAAAVRQREGTGMSQTSEEMAFRSVCASVLTLRLLSGRDLRPLRPLRQSPHPAEQEETSNKQLVTESNNKVNTDPSHSLQQSVQHSSILSASLQLLLLEP